MIVCIDDCAFDAEVELRRELEWLEFKGYAICPRCNRSYLVIDVRIEDRVDSRSIVYGYRCEVCNLWRPFEEIVLRKVNGCISICRRLLRMIFS